MIAYPPCDDSTLSNAVVGSFKVEHGLPTLATTHMNRGSELRRRREQPKPYITGPSVQPTASGRQLRIVSVDSTFGCIGLPCPYCCSMLQGDAIDDCCVAVNGYTRLLWSNANHDSRPRARPIAVYSTCRPHRGVAQRQPRGTSISGQTGPQGGGYALHPQRSIKLPSYKAWQLRLYSVSDFPCIFLRLSIDLSACIDRPAVLAICHLPS
jgi:hypothetical protein